MLYCTSNIWSGSFYGLEPATSEVCVCHEIPQLSKWDSNLDPDILKECQLMRSGSKSLLLISFLHTVKIKYSNNSENFGSFGSQISYPLRDIWCNLFGNVINFQYILHACLHASQIEFWAVLRKCSIQSKNRHQTFPSQFYVLCSYSQTFFTLCPKLSFCPCQFHISLLMPRHNSLDPCFCFVYR